MAPIDKVFEALGGSPAKPHQITEAQALLLDALLDQLHPELEQQRPYDLAAAQGPTEPNEGSSPGEVWKNSMRCYSWKALELRVSVPRAVPWGAFAPYFEEPFLKGLGSILAKSAAEVRKQQEEGSVGATDTEQDVSTLPFSHRLARTVDDAIRICYGPHPIGTIVSNTGCWSLPFGSRACSSPILMVFQGRESGLGVRMTQSVPYGMLGLSRQW